MSAQAIALDYGETSRLIRKLIRLHGYDTCRQPYLTYPEPRAFCNTFTAEDFQDGLASANSGGQPLSLHVQIPFCRTYDITATARQSPVVDTPMMEAYLTRLDREMVLTARQLDHRQGIRELHWGGAGATSFSLGQMSDLIDRLNARFGLVESRERDYVIEVNPRESNVLTLRHLQALGFNRLILDVRDLDPAAQHTINGIQPRAKVELLVDEAHRLKLDALTMDLRIGLPYQTPESLDGTLEQIIAMAPARIRIIPPPWKPQLLLKTLRHRYPGPDAIDSVQTLMMISLERLVEAGYVHLGQGHFARPKDSLALAQKQGRLAISLQGYALVDSPVQLGLGVAAISRVDGVYACNALSLRGYEHALDAGRLATVCGLKLTDDQRLRRDIIEKLVCDMALDPRRLTDAFGVGGDACMAGLERDGVLARQGQRLLVTPAGRILLGDIVLAFTRR